jgi:hypothetical protein
MTELTTSIENVGHKFFIENFFSPDDYLLTNTINSCDTARPNQKGMPMDFGKKLQMRQGDMKTNVRAVKRQTKCKHADKYASCSSRWQIL